MFWDRQEHPAFSWLAVAWAIIMVLIVVGEGIWLVVHVRRYRSGLLLLRRAFVDGLPVFFFYHFLWGVFVFINRTVEEWILALAWVFGVLVLIPVYVIYRRAAELLVKSREDT